MISTGRRRSGEEGYIGQIRRSRKHRQRGLTKSQKLLSSSIDFFSTKCMGFFLLWLLYGLMNKLISLCDLNFDLRCFAWVMREICACDQLNCIYIYQCTSLVIFHSNIGVCIPWYKRSQLMIGWMEFNLMRDPRN